MRVILGDVWREAAVRCEVRTCLSLTDGVYVGYDKGSTAKVLRPHSREVGIGIDTKVHQHAAGPPF